MVEIISMPTSMRLGANRSARIRVPDVTGGRFILDILLTPEDIVDPRKSVVFSMLWLREDGVWAQFASTEFICGPHHNPTGPNWEGIQLETTAPWTGAKDISFEVELPVKMRIGAILNLM